MKSFISRVVGGWQMGTSPVGQGAKQGWGLWLDGLLHESHMLAETQGWCRCQHFGC